METEMSLGSDLPHPDPVLCGTMGGGWLGAGLPPRMDSTNVEKPTEEVNSPFSVA
jgi:hypothetical protein